MKTVSIAIEGVAPLIMHNARLSDPLDEYAIALAEVSSKRKKIVADYREMERIEWHGGIYLDDEGHPCVPQENLERLLRDGAAKSRQGKNAQAGLRVEKEAPLIYDGPRDIEKLWPLPEYRFRSSVKVSTSRVMRTRPIFREWKLRFEVIYNESILSKKAILGFLAVSGELVGLGDWRPKYGRFEIMEAE